MHRIKMIAMDFDWTLLDHTGGKKYIPSDTLALINRLIAGGILVGIDSGRQAEALLDTLRLAGVQPGRPFPSFFMDQENFIYWNRGHRDPHRIYDWDKDGMFVSQGGDNDTLQAANDAFCRRLAGRVADMMAAIDAQGWAVEKWIVFSQFGMEIHFTEADCAQQAIALLEDFFTPQDGVALHRNTSIVNVVPAGSGKGAALLRAARYCGYAPGDVLAIGDSLNDISMLSGEYGFLSGCVGNADPIVKELVRKNDGYVSDKPAGDGVYDVIRHYAARGYLDAEIFSGDTL
ncbi:MAG: HAD family hydrolase [Eubacteriales bacterium]|nr:HAD family hydrolase [Eubacteriales bacterium]